MHGDGRVDQVAAQAPKARERAILVRAREPAVADDIGDQDRRDLPGLAHRAALGPLRLSTTADNAPPALPPGGVRRNLGAAPWLSGFSSNCFRKIEAHAMVTTAMTNPIDSAHTSHCQRVFKPTSRGEKKNGVGSRRKGLKRLDPDKATQGNARVFL